MTVIEAFSSPARVLQEKLENRTAIIGIIGLGYVGLPLASATVRARFQVLGFDIDEEKIGRLNRGESYLGTVSGDTIQEHRAAGLFRATADFSELALCDAIVICVPTPLTKQREPDLSAVSNTVRSIATHLRAGQLVVLESTTYPGTTREVVTPLLERSGLVNRKDFFVGFSPEREDPGNPNYGTADIPKVIAGDGPDASRLMAILYGAIVRKVVPVSSTDAAEAVKITENIFRAVNIALVNELKVTFDALGIDIWEVIEAAKTKPFGFMPFYPGPGLGGHCIPIDPFYLTWKAREHDLSTRFVELAGEINVSMPRYVAQKLVEALDSRHGVGLSNSRILIIGMAYKKNVDDIRESPSFKLMSLLERRGARVDYHDPHVPEIGRTREHPEYAGRKSIPLHPKAIASYHAVLLVADHDILDYALIAAHSKLIIDTRNAFARRGLNSPNIVKA
jgi:UDP-N-acetyl-D-glucosamine dehydrogenase